MWYIFRGNECVATCDFEPNFEDLATRGEEAIELNEVYDISNIVFIDGKIQPRPPYVPTQDELKAAKLHQIDLWTANAITGGFTSTCTGSPVRFDSDKDTQITMQGIALNAMSERFTEEYPDGCPVRGYAEGESTKTIFMLSGDQVLNFCADLSLHIGACKIKGWQLQRAVAEATTQEELDRIVWGCN